ncbi:MAG: hypothetical protein PHF26_01255 [Candidatus Gracilibacteria bacterium]|nr:hypothetical protein [Candidatus Gracilibacteria bacterium]
MLEIIPCVSAAASSAILDPNEAYEISDLIRMIIALIILFSGILSVFFIIWGGVMIILSGGKDDKVKPAINSIRYAIVGLVLIVVAVFFAPRIGDLLGLSISNYISADTIFTEIRSLGEKIFGGGSGNGSVNVDIKSGQLPADFSDL